MSDTKDVQSFANYFPHVLFVLAQIMCGSFFVLLVIPQITFLIGSPFTFSHLLAAFPSFWKWLLSLTSFSGLLIWLGLTFPIGICLAEFFYRVGRKIGYINDLGLENGQRDATQLEQVDLFIWKCRLQNCPWLSRIWEWENFQSNLFFYAEGISLLFCFLLGLCIVLTACLSEIPLLGQIRPFLCIVVLWLSSAIVSYAMRQGRIGKYQSFRLAHQAVKRLLGNQGEAESRSYGDTQDDH